MTYRDLFESEIKQRWKVGTCNQGEICWCRTVETEEPMYGEDGELYLVIPLGSISKELAEYIVELHNSALNLK